jgi:formylglycine-generating enzyme required for sulfatase activity
LTDTSFRVLRGGEFGDIAEQLRSAGGDWTAGPANYPGYVSIGVRCARTSL